MRIYSIGAVTDTHIHNSGVALKTASGAGVRIAVLDHDIVRVTILPEGDYRLKRTWWVVDETGDTPREGRLREDLSPFSLPAFEYNDDDEKLLIRTHKLQLIVYKAEFRIEWHTLETIPFAEDSPIRAYATHPSSTDLFHYMSCRPDDRYYGFGEVSGKLNKHGRRLEMRALDALGYNAETSDPLYKHFPFYVTLTPQQNIAYGLFYDNMSHVTFDMGRERHAYYQFYRYMHATDGDLEYYLIYGPTIADVVQKFTALIGRMPLPPRWSLGYLGSTMMYTEMPDAQEQLKRFAEDSQKYDIPCDLFHLSSGYTVNPHDGTRNVFTWNSQRIPDPKAMVQHFHDAGINLSANIKPYLLKGNTHYAALDEKQGFIRDAKDENTLSWLAWAASFSESSDAGFVDFTSAVGFDWWKQAATEHLLNYGIDSLWNDNNEYGIWDDDAQCNGFGESVNLGKIRPLQHLLMVRASTEAQRENRPDERPFVLTRSACPGSQRYAQTWSGDNTTSWHTLKYNIPMGLSLSLSGMANIGHDVGGFAGDNPSPELLVCWIQNGIFHPRFTIHSAHTGAQATEPWMYPKVLPLIREAIHFRYRLIPYLYATFYEAHRQGKPIIAPMVYHFQDDPLTHQQDFDFMLGDYLLVASVYVAGATTRQVYLPQGTRWCDWHTGTWYEGGQTITVDAPLERFPLLVRENGIIPMRASARAEQTRQLYLFPAASGTALLTMLEDDGVSINGESTLLHCRLDCESDHIQLTIQAEGDYMLPYDEIGIILPEAETRPLDVTVEGLTLQITQR